MKRFLLIFIGKLLLFVGHLVKRGSTMPGYYIYKLDENFLDKIKFNSKVIAVTGSSGKGSTTKMIANVCKSLGYTVGHNDTGANTIYGIISLVLDNCNLKGEVNKDYLVLECDERWTKYMFHSIKPDYITITNITRDQPPRQGNIDVVFNAIKDAITKDSHIIINADDPYLQKLTFGIKNIISYYGIEKNKYSTNELTYENTNLLYCPKCNTKLEYNYYHFENIGDYKCPKCDFKRPNVDYLATSIDFEKKSFIINKNINIHLSFEMLFVVYNTLAAYSTLVECGLDKALVQKTMNDHIVKDKKLFNCFEQKNRLVYSLNNKNENSTTFNHSLLLVDRDKKPKTIVIGWKEVSRRYTYNDLSWLYDINFELLLHHKIESIVCVGLNSYDIATRIKLCGIDPKKIKCFDNQEDSTKYLREETKENIYAILNFDYVNDFVSLMKGEEQ